MLDDEVQALEVGGRVVDVGDVEGVLVQRPDRRALVHVDVLDAQLLGPLQEAVALGVGELEAARVTVPLRGVELDALGVPLLDLGLELAHAGVAVARVEPAVHDELVGVLFDEVAVLRGGVEAVLVPLAQVGRLQDRDVDVALLELLAHQLLFGDLLELLDRLVGLGRSQRLVGVEALDPALGVLLGTLDPVLGRGVPVVHVGVDDEVLLTVLLVHGDSLLVRTDERSGRETWWWTRRPTSHVMVPARASPRIPSTAETDIGDTSARRVRVGRCASSSPADTARSP